MTTEEMLDSLWAVFAQIRADQKKEEYGDTRGLKDSLEWFLNMTTTTFCAENKEKVVNSSRIHDFLVEISGIEPRKL